MMITTVSDPNQPTLFPLPSRPEMERAYLRSDASYDGLFFLGVRTTGVFCRPSCHARKPKPENVDFFASSGEAIEAGYRACLKCKPVGGTDEPAWVRALFRRLEARPAARVTERDLRAMQLDPERVRRYFSARYGLTFQAYCRARRLAGAFEQLKDGRALVDAVFDTGYESHSGFRDAFRKAFGRPPGQAAAAACIQVAWLDTPLGPVIAGATDRGRSSSRSPRSAGTSRRRSRRDRTATSPGSRRNSPSTSAARDGRSRCRSTRRARRSRSACGGRSSPSRTARRDRTGTSPAPWGVRRPCAPWAAPTAAIGWPS
jgi:methylphosphotriester-DNA--protein-cysteine methyltransferase